MIAYAKQLLGDPNPAPEEPGLRQLTVDAKQRVSVTAAQPLAEGRVVSLVIRPGDWMDRAQPAVAEIVTSLKTRLAALGPLMGLPAQLGPQLVDELAAILRATSELRITIDEPGEGLDLSLTLLPKEQTGLAEWMSCLIAGQARTALPADPDAALRMRVCLAPGRVAAAVAPFLDSYNALRTNPADLAEARDDLAQMVACFDGAFEVVADSDGMRMALGLSDPPTHQRLMTSEAAMRRARERLASQRIDVEYAPAAFRHRDIAPLRTTLLPDQPVEALANSAGEVVSYTATVGDSWFSIVGSQGGEESMIKAIDGVLDGKLFRPPTGTGTASDFLQIQLGFSQLANYVGAAADILSVGNFAGLQATAARTGQQLQIQIKLR